MLRALPPGYVSGDTVYCYFPSYDSNGGSITITGLAVTDIEIYKDGSTTQRSSDNGYTLLDTDGIDFDGSTGLQGFSVDTSDNSDAGFWADGSHYLIWVDAVTIDGQTVRLGFELLLGMVLRPTTAGRTLDVAATGEAGVDLGNVTGTLTQNNVGWVDENSQVDVGKWNTTAVSVSPSSSLPQVDVESVDGSTTAAENLKQSCLALATGTVAAAAGDANTATDFDTDLTQENANYYGNASGGLVVAFVDTEANQYQTRRVVASSSVGGNTRLTVEEAFDATPAAGDVFVILGRISELT